MHLLGRKNEGTKSKRKTFFCGKLWRKMFVLVSEYINSKKRFHLVYLKRLFLSPPCYETFPRIFTRNPCQFYILIGLEFQINNWESQPKGQHKQTNKKLHPCTEKTERSRSRSKFPNLISPLNLFVMGKLITFYIRLVSLLYFRIRRIWLAKVINFYDSVMWQEDVEEQEEKNATCLIDFVQC